MPRAFVLAVVVLQTLSLILTGIDAAEPRPRDDDCHQWCCSFRKAAAAPRDPAFSEREASTSLGPESAQRYGEWLVAPLSFPERWAVPDSVTA